MPARIPILNKKTLAAPGAGLVGLISGEFLRDSRLRTDLGDIETFDTEAEL